MNLVIIIIIVSCILLAPLRKEPGMELTGGADVFNDHISFLTYSAQFKSDKIVLIHNALAQPIFDALLADARAATPVRSEFEHIRKASAVKSSDLGGTSIAKLYASSSFVRGLQTITGISLHPSEGNDESRINLLVYDRPGDFINWHHDPNHYMGNRITVLINLVNRSHTGLSSSVLRYKTHGQTKSLQMPPNSLLVFDGTQVEHMATGIETDQQRVLVSFTYCDVCRPIPLRLFVKKIKDTILGY